jgi:hypothetical protein
MTRPLFLLIGALTFAGCADSTDERPATFEYLVTAVLAPSCGTATCHSSMTNTSDYAFDTVAAARATFRRRDLVTQLDEPDANRLMRVVLTDGSGDDPRMPVDSPLPDADIQLMRQWIIDGAVVP